MNMSPSWSYSTLILYILMGILGAWCCQKAKRTELMSGIKRTILSREYWPLYAVWVFLAVFRLIEGGIGGTDAPNYIKYFQECLTMSEDSTEVVFKWFNQGIRLVFSDYHWYFLLFYSLLVITMVFVINEFSRTETTCIPLCILVFLFIRSFSAMRSIMAGMILLVSVVFLNRKAYWQAALFAVLAVFTHVSAIIYTVFYAYYFLFYKREISVRQSIVLFVLAYGVAVVGQQLIVSGALPFLRNIGTGAYESYASYSLGKSFLEMFNISNIPQVALAAAMMLFQKEINGKINAQEPTEARKLKVLTHLCYFDLFAVPVITVLGVYRGYEYFYVARLVMWGELIPIVQSKVKDMLGPKFSHYVPYAFTGVFILWMCTRFEAYSETSGLMPYMLEFFR